MTEIYLHFMFAHYGLYGNAPVTLALLSGQLFWRLMRGWPCLLHTTDYNFFDPDNFLTLSAVMTPKR